MEQDMEILDIGQNKSIQLKPQPKKGLKGLEVDNYVIVEKLFEEGKRFEKQFGEKLAVSYLVGVKYKDTQVSFFIKQKEYEEYQKVAAVGDKVKVTLKKESFVNNKTGVEMLFNKLYFEKVE